MLQMEYFKITKNGKDLVKNLSKVEAIEKLFSVVETFSNGYIYDNEAETIYHEVDSRVIAKKGDDYVRAGDDFFEVIIDNKQNTHQVLDLVYTVDEGQECFEGSEQECYNFIKQHGGASFMYKVVPIIN